ncbi:MAG: hypothetical protein HY296_08285 [Thaumarchaeota archaeon]|nr:hypothetical protein [Nitrososphaerota archaeon]
MRESSKIDKTKLPVDAYELWLKAQNVNPRKQPRPEKHGTDYYDDWINQRVKTKIREARSKSGRNKT